MRRALLLLHSGLVHPLALLLGRELTEPLQPPPHHLLVVHGLLPCEETASSKKIDRRENRCMAYIRRSSYNG